MHLPLVAGKIPELSCLLASLQNSDMKGWGSLCWIFSQKWGAEIISVIFVCVCVWAAGAHICTKSCWVGSAAGQQGSNRTPMWRGSCRAPETPLPSWQERSFGEIKGGNAQQGSVQSWLWFVSCCWAMQGRSASQNSRGTLVGLIPGRMEQVSPDHCCSPLALQRGLQWNSWEPREPLFVGNHHHQAFFHGSKSRVCWGEQHFDPSG